MLDAAGRATTARSGELSTRLGTAAEHASLAVPVAATDDRVEEVVVGLRCRRFESAAVVAVCDDRRLAGLVSIERLLSAPVHTRVGDVMDPRPPIVAPGTGPAPGAGACRRRLRGPVPGRDPAGSSARDPAPRT
jgi:magnesium transporter